MIHKNQKVKYTRCSIHHGPGPIPLESVGEVLLIVENTSIRKALVDFGKYGKAIVPLSCLEGAK